MTRLRTRKVSPVIKARLDLAADVIKDVQRLLPFGQGNQVPNVKATHGRAAYLTYHVQAKADSHWWEHPLRKAGVTAGYGAGNCQDIAAVVYTVLRSRLSADDKTAYCQNPHIVHWFSTIGNPETDPENEVVVVDPWPLRPQACLLEDHFCRSDVVVHSCKCGGKPDFRHRLAKHRPIDSNRKRNYAKRNTFEFDFDFSQDSHLWWRHVYCTDVAVKIVYEV